MGDSAELSPPKVQLSEEGCKSSEEKELPTAPSKQINCGLTTNTTEEPSLNKGCFTEGFTQGFLKALSQMQLMACLVIINASVAKLGEENLRAEMYEPLLIENQSRNKTNLKW